ncbi:MAG: DsrE family protein [Methylococcaceae bacterium]
MNTSVRKITIIFGFLVCMFGFQNIANARTMVVQISSFNPTESVHGLIFALHSLKDSRGEFGNEPYDLTVKVVFNGEGVLNASNKIKHPRIRIATRPDDPRKTARRLIRELRKEDVEMRATGFGLKQYGINPKEDLIRGVKGGGANVIPRFIISPEETDGVVVVNF